MKPSCVHFSALVVVAFMLVGCRARLNEAGRRQSGSVATKPMQNSSWNGLRAPRSQVPSAAAGKHKQRPPRVYFLFLAVSKISNFAVWKSFFNAAPTDRYRAFIHCKGAICKLFASNSKLLRLVPTVDASYCGDLVSPMNQLLAASLRDDPGSANPGDKFVFVSDSTLPAKPFAHIYDTLIQRQGSDFCMFPSKDWADNPVKIVQNGGEPGSGHELAIKTHQWIVLTRAHSERSVHLWNEGIMHDMMTNFKLNQANLWQDPANRTFGDNRNFGCLDEYWHMYVLFGPWTITDTKETAEYHYNDLTNSPVKIKHGAGWQGACDTFALWSEYQTTPFETPQGQTVHDSPWMKLYSSLDHLSIPHSSSTGPAWWSLISRHGIKAISDSDFLFVRKFQDKPVLANGGDFGEEYIRIVLHPKTIVLSTAARPK